MNKICCLLLLFLFISNGEAQITTTVEHKSSKAGPKVGRYVQRNKERTVAYRQGSSRIQIHHRLTSVDVLNDKEMKINFIIENPRESKIELLHKTLRNTPFFIVDENLVKYQQLQELKASWLVSKKSYILAPTEKVKGSVVFPVLVNGARRFDLFFGYDNTPIKDIQLIE